MWVQNGIIHVRKKYPKVQTAHAPPSTVCVQGTLILKTAVRALSRGLRALLTRLSCSCPSKTHTVLLGRVVTTSEEKEVKWGGGGVVESPEGNELVTKNGQCSRWLADLARVLQERNHLKNVLERCSAPNHLSSYFQSLTHPLVNFSPVPVCFHIRSLEPVNVLIHLRV